jgi:hypothetical protein
MLVVMMELIMVEFRNCSLQRLERSRFKIDIQIVLMPFLFFARREIRRVVRDRGK